MSLRWTNGREVPHQSSSSAGFNTLQNARPSEDLGQALHLWRGRCRHLVDARARSSSANVVHWIYSLRLTLISGQPPKSRLKSERGHRRGRDNVPTGVRAGGLVSVLEKRDSHRSAIPRPIVVTRIDKWR